MHLPLVQPRRTHCAGLHQLQPCNLDALPAILLTVCSAACFITTPKWCRTFPHAQEDEETGRRGRLAAAELEEEEEEEEGEEGEGEEEAPRQARKRGQGEVDASLDMMVSAAQAGGTGGLGWAGGPQRGGGAELGQGSTQCGGGQPETGRGSICWHARQLGPMAESECTFC